MDHSDRCVIDIHTHILPRTWPDLAERYGYGGFVKLIHESPGCARMVIDGKDFRTVDENCWSPQVRLRECDRDGVHVQVLSTVPVMFSYWARPRDGLDLSRMLNDHIADVVRDDPDRFLGLGTLPMQDPDLAIGELERCVTILRMPGVQIGTHVNQWNLNAPELFPVFEAAARLNACVFVHPWDMMGADRMKQYWMPWLVGMPAETSLAIGSLIFGGVLERLPGLRIAFAHGGGAFPMSFGRMEHAFHVRPDLCAVDNPYPPSKYLHQMYFDSLVHDVEGLRFLIKMVGVDRVALGTDYPFPLGETQPGALIGALHELDAASHSRLLCGTACEWLARDLSQSQKSSSNT
ncbi:MAG TPA: amidohydrolase family protein [Pirellulaceae bacterium]|nr:amidohydrolase family protein [Pirellulaceae bacterium]